MAKDKAKRQRDADPDAEPVEVILQKLSGKLQGEEGSDLVNRLHAEVYHELSGLVGHTVSTGSSNSVLVLGPNNVGKTALINRVVDKVANSALIVKLSGILQTDDKLALREIAIQLKLENVVSGTERVFGSFAQHLAFLLESLKSGGAKTSAPIVFVLDHFELFCHHHNQTLLYNLFDIAQTQAAPICVIGVSSHFDVVESLEKRVKSRFNHRQLVLLPPSSFEEYYKMVRDVLMVGEAHTDWNSSVTKTLDSGHTLKLFKSIYASNNTFGYLKQYLVVVLSLIDPFQPLTFEHLSEVYTSQAEPSSERGLLQGISVLELCVLVAVKHVLAVYPDQQAFNFEMAFHEYDKFAVRKAKLFRYDRSVVMKAWEALQDLELITPVDKGVTKVQKEFRLFTLQVLPDQILAVVDANAPLTVKEWATSVTFQD